MTTDFWDRIMPLERIRDRDAAGDLLNRILATPWHSLSYGDSIEVFNYLLRLEELCPGLLESKSSAVIARIRSDSRSGHRQDQISKADIVHRLAGAFTSEDLFALAHEERQDLDTRNAAVQEFWEASGVADSVAVDEVRSFLKELLQRARSEGQPASAFMVGVAYRLLRFEGITEEDRALIESVYSFWQPDEPIDKWFRTQATMAGLAREPRERGGRSPLVVK